MQNVKWWPLVYLLLLMSCQNETSSGYSKVENPYAIAAINDDDRINMIVEIPAGTNHKIEYNGEKNEFVNDQNADGSTRVISFLPYPGNYGFIPGTLMDRERGGDGDPLDIFLISEALLTGTIVPVIPIGALLLRDRGEIDTKIIAIPADSTNQVMSPTDFLDFSIHHDAAKQIIETWFLHYKGRGQTELIRWEDENYAWEEVRKWKVKQTAPPAQ